MVGRNDDEGVGNDMPAATVIIPHDAASDPYPLLLMLGSPDLLLGHF